MSSIWRGLALESPRSVFTITGRKQRTAAMAIFECGDTSPNHAPAMGAKAMIGTALAAIAIGISAVPTLRKRPTTVATAMPRQIGRASCRERVEIAVVAVSLKEKTRPKSARRDDVAT